MSLTRVSAPPVNPVTDAEVWDHLRVPLVGSPAVPVDQSHIAALTAAAVAYLDGKDGILGRALVQQTWDLKLDRFPRNRDSGYDVPYFVRNAIRVPLPPLQSVTSITYIDPAGDEQTLSDTLYTVDTSSEPGRITPAYGQCWPQTQEVMNAVTVRFVAGYDVDSPTDYGANVPGPIKSAIKLLVSEMYQNRGETVVGMSVAELPFAATTLLAPHRVWAF